MPNKIMMKKYARKVLAATMAVSMMVPMMGMNVFAAEPDTKQTQVKYEVTQGYEWTIHSEIDFGKDKGVNQTVTSSGKNTVSVNKNIIPDGKTLNITVKGSGKNGEYEIKSGTTVLTYTIKEGTGENVKDVTVGGNVIALAAGHNDASKDLTFTLTTGSGSAEVAGSYTGTVTYTAAIQ